MPGVAEVPGDDAAGTDGVPDGLGVAAGVGVAVGEGAWLGVAVGEGAVLAGTSYWYRLYNFMRAMRFAP